MRLFLSVVPVAEAVKAVRSLAQPAAGEDVPLADALSRILAENVRADIDIPGFNRSTVDGYAVVADDTVGAGESMPAMLTCTGRVAMGSPDPGEIGSGLCTYVPTGGAIPRGADAVAMIEYCEQAGDEVLVHRPVAPGENVVYRGEDFAASEAILAKGQRLSARDLGVAAAAGKELVRVIMPPRIGIISTGNEVVPISAVPGSGEVRDVNTYICGGFAEEQGCKPVYYGIVKDDPEALAAALGAALSECDAVLISGGSSKDLRDASATVIGDLGEVLIHGIAIAPGKPTIIGKARGKPVIGLPGHPGSATIVLFAVVRHLLAAMTGATAAPLSVPAVLALNVPSARGREDYVRVAVQDGRATPLFGKSGLLNTLVRSTGIIRVPAGSEGLEAGETVEVFLW